MYCDDLLLQFRLHVFIWWEQMFLLLPPGSPCSAGSCCCTRALKKQERRKERGPSWPQVCSKCWTETAALSSLELHPSLSGHLPESTSLSHLEFATETSHPETLTYSASFEWLHDLPPLYHVLIVMSLQPKSAIKEFT